MSNTDQTVYQFKAKNLYGEEISLEDFKGKVLLIVNTASECGFTPQLNGLQHIYEQYKDRGFEVLAFPSNQFMGQEPLEGDQIASFCQKNYGVDFSIFEKTDVKGKDAHPLYQFLSDKKQNGKVNSIPKWNFHKYLVDRNGKVVDYFYSMTDPDGKKITKKIEELL